MIKESFDKNEAVQKEEKYSYKIMFFESIATSIDALSSCIILPSIKLNPIYSCLIIFIVTSLICLFGHELGKKIGLKLKEKASLLGGLILIFLGIKTVLEHLGIF